MWMHPHTTKLMKTNTNTPEAKQPPSAGCIPRLVLGSSDTPETDDLADEIYARGIRVSEIRMLQHARELEKRLNALYETTVTAICILDGNADVIDWRDRNQPELLRKLCEHLEAQCGRSISENTQAQARPALLDAECSKQPKNETK